MLFSAVGERGATLARMKLAALVLVSLVALAHVYFLVLEMFLWRKPYGRRVFHNTVEFADASAVLAANQGLYNGFLAAGLVWGLTLADPAHSLAVQTFFLSCVIVAGLYGAATASRAILFAQALPAIVALVVLRLA